MKELKKMKRTPRKASATALTRPCHIALFSALVSLFTLVAYNIPLLKGVVESLEGGLNGVLIFGGLVAIILAVHFLLVYLLLYLGRTVGKIVIAISLICNSLALYFINGYEVLITSEMMGNVFNTRYSEASGFFSLSGVAYVVLLGILPCYLLFKTKINYGKAKQLGISSLVALVTIVVFGVVNLNNTLWIDRNVPRLGSLILPWSYTVNTVRYYNSWKRLNQKEITLPDATIGNTDKEVCVLIIGESARSANFSIYGYDRPTTPLIENDGVEALKAESAATYTTAGVKAIIDHKPTDELYEILPNYLYRNGVDVLWRTSNWGEPPLHIARIEKVSDLKARYPNVEAEYDGILVEGLGEVIEASDKSKMFVVLHTSTSHGPTYYKKYPAEFERFTPVCTTVEMSEADTKELINAYDNTILYTDYLIHSVIEQLRGLKGWRSTLLFVSDHGESLGENNLYMHGMPKAMAPREQFDIPFIVWTSDSRTATQSEVGQYHVFHTVLRALSIESEVYNAEYDIFSNNTR
jgi:lipid A ethanolaminephosphotransferase